MLRGKGFPPTIVVCDPRLFRNVAEVLRTLKVDFRVPESLPLRMDEGTVIADDECRSYVEGSAQIYVVNRANVWKIALLIAGRRGNTLQVGIDLGSKIAYVALLDDLLLRYGYVESSEELASEVGELVDLLSPKNTIIKVGSPERRLSQEARRIAKLMPQRNCEVYVVNEERSNKALAILRSAYPEIKGVAKDIIAALNIALRDGVKIR
ncbi:MAG: hypothetical protein J7L55_02975 [Desulfurococcales archaeon]|nr:hypothetical protein [Desulfurococcales archaeon]